LERFELEFLTEEHIVPMAIGGSLVIRNGSCRNCAEFSNSSYENQALNEDLKIPKFLLGLKGRGKGNLPKNIRHLPSVHAGHAMTKDLGERLDFSPELYPKVFSLIVFQPPGFLAGIERGGMLSNPGWQIFNLGGKQATGVTVRVKHTNGPFAKTLAKIGYCYAVAELGLDGFDGRAIRDLLRGKRDDVYNFVGSIQKPEFLTKAPLHGLYIRRRGDWLTVLIHLFASCDNDHAKPSIPYEVVVGKSND